MGFEIPDDRIVDRKKELDEFQKLLLFQEPAHLLVIQDAIGTGKTTLLRKLKYYCDIVEIPRKPAGMLDLENDKIISAFSLVERIRQCFPQLKFDAFDRLNNVRKLRSKEKFADELQNIQQNFSGATFSGGTVTAIGRQLNLTGANVGQLYVESTSGPWTEELEDLAAQKSIDAFFAEVKTIADTQPVILLLDSYDDRTNKDLQMWIRDNLVFPLCFDLENRPAKFILVLSGRQLPFFKPLLEHATYGPLIKPNAPLSSWIDSDIEDILKEHNKIGLTPEQLKLIVDYVKSGGPIQYALLMADGYLVNKR